MKYVLDQHDLVARFVAAMIPHVAARGFGPCRTIGIVDGNDELVAGLVYHHFDPEAGLMEISGAALPGHQWATRQTLRLMHAFPFEQCNCQMVMMRVPFANERLLRQLFCLGYEFIKFPRMFGRHEDGVVCYLTDDEWRSNKIARRLNRAFTPVNGLLRAEAKQEEAA